jgi:hypothetical protein
MLQYQPVGTAQLQLQQDRHKAKDADNCQRDVSPNHRSRSVYLFMISKESSMTPHNNNLSKSGKMTADINKHSYTNLIKLYKAHIIDHRGGDRKRLS